MVLRGGGGRAYQQVHLETFAAVTHCDLPWALGTARAQTGRGGGARAEEEGRVREKKKKRGSVRVFIVFSCD